MENSDNLLIFCRNIQYLRRSNNISRTKMAKLLHIRLQTLDHLERGVVPPLMSCTVLFYAMKHFHLRLNQLFEPHSEWSAPQ